tara:strand:- start:2532 stop:5210 length:2679 start_codon:yes stop_codon:yes gene_type:complete
MMKFKVLASIFLIVSLIFVVGASSEFDDFQIFGIEYAGGDVISGSFNLSFADEENNNFGNSFSDEEMSLLDFLEAGQFVRGQDNDYYCSPSNCEKGYTSSNGEVSKSFTVVPGEKYLLGLVFSGKDVVVRDDEFTLDVSSSVGTSNFNQLVIDLFNDGSIDFLNKNYIDDAFTSKDYGCFSDSESDEEVDIPEDPFQPYCEKITMPVASAYKVGANIKDSTTGVGEIKMEIYDYNDSSSPLGSCTLPVHPGGTVELDCIVEYAARAQFDSFVCIYSDNGDYRIRTDSTAVCGMQVPDSNQDFQLDYEIFGQALKYDSLDTTFNEDLYQDLGNEGTLSFALQDYIDSSYGGQCDPECVVPLKMFGINQDATLDNFQVKYDAIGKTGATSTKLYDIEENDFIISSNGTLVGRMDWLNISVPDFSGTKNFELEYDGSLIFDELISIETGFTFDVNPKTVLIGSETEFKVAYTGNITKSNWDFGDGASLKNQGKEVVHRYDMQGNYELEVEVFAKNKSSKKKFTVIVGSPKESAQRLLNEYDTRVSNLSSQLTGFGPFVQIEVEKQVDVVNYKLAVDREKESFDLALVDEDYLDIIDNLLVLSVPSSIYVASSGRLPAAVSYEFIDVGYAEELNNVDHDDFALKQAIIEWINMNYGVEVEFEEVVALDDFGEQTLLTKFRVLLSKKGEDTGNLYIDYPLESLIFKEGYGQKQIGGSGTFIDLSDEGNDVEFLILDSVEVEDLGIYIAPDVSRFNVEEGEILGPGEGGKPFPWGWVLLWLAVIVIGTLILYVILQEWYKRHYERYLFKNKDDLYNLVNFIYNGRSSGLKDAQVRSKLGKAGWTGEQIRYGFKKIDGKRTGMWEIPLFKFFENKKVEKEIQKRQRKPVDVRFIKRPSI